MLDLSTHFLLVVTSKRLELIEKQIGINPNPNQLDISTHVLQERELLKPLIEFYKKIGDYQ